MIQFQENAWTDKRTDRRMEGTTDSTLSEPSGYRRESKKHSCE